jgi:hypothetical protein
MSKDLFTSQEQARNIMGHGMLGIPEIERDFGVLTDDQRKTLEMIPFSLPVLRNVDNFILVADIGLSILDLREKDRHKRVFGKDQIWPEQKEYCNRTEAPCWRLICIDPIEQERFDAQVYEISSARQVVYAGVLYYLSKSVELFDDAEVRTSDLHSRGIPVVVGYSYDHGLEFGYSIHNPRAKGVALASARIPLPSC